MAVGLGAGLFERERQLEQLDAALSAVLAGVGQVVVVQGSPGIGKSRLLDALCARAGGTARVLRGRGGELERELPLAVVRELFESAVLRAAEGERSRLLAGAAGLAGPLLGVGTADGGAVDSTFAVMHGLYWLTANLADDGPLVLAVDDAHWTDEATQRWLAYLVPRISELPVLLAVAFRPRELDPASTLAVALAAEPEAMLVEPGALGVKSTGGMVADALGDVDLEFRDAVHRATGGNPLLVRTLVGALAASGVRPTASEAGRVRSVGIDRIGRIVLPRMHRLGRDAVEFARAAAVLGEGASAADARALTGLDEPAARAAVDALVVAEVLRPDGSLGAMHPLVRAAVAGELLPGSRADLHRRAAERRNAAGGGPEEVALHLLSCEPIGEEWALTALRAAGQLAVERGAPGAAVVFLERGLGEATGGNGRAELLFDLGRAGFQACHPSTIAWLREALEHAVDASLWMQAFLELSAQCLYSHTSFSIELLATAPQLGEEHVLALSAMLVLDLGFFEPSARLPAPLVSVPEQLPPLDNPFARMCVVAAMVDTVMESDRAERVSELAERALSGGELPIATGDAWQFAWLTIALIWSGDLRRAKTELVGAHDRATRGGSLVAVEWVSTGLGLAHYSVGELADAEAHHLTALETETAGSFAFWIPGKVSFYVDVLRERGRYADAESVLADHGLLNDAPPSHVWGARLLESRGRLRLAQGRVDEALKDLRACGATLSGFGKPRSAGFGWRAGVALCLAAQGERTEAVRLAGEQTADARRFGAAPWLGSSLRALGTVTGGAEGIALLREAVDVLGGSDAKLEYAHALCDLGVLLRHDRRPREAREPLRQALDLAERCCAYALADQATEELAAAGARPRRRAITGAESLTPTERRVAVLAARGKSNPEIAQSLFVTRKTVEKHLGSVFLKLQITARAQLAAALEGSS